MTQEGAQPAADDPFNTFLLLFARRQRELCFSTRSPRKSGLQNRGLERFAGKLVVRKPDCPFFLGGKAARAVKAWSRFFHYKGSLFFFCWNVT